MQHALSKLTSGRWLLTLCAGFTFCWCSITGVLEAQAISAIVTAVFMAYFQRNDRQNGDGKPTSTPTPA